MKKYKCTTTHYFGYIKINTGEEFFENAPLIKHTPLVSANIRPKPPLAKQAVKAFPSCFEEIQK